MKKIHSFIIIMICALVLTGGTQLASAQFTTSIPSQNTTGTTPPPPATTGTNNPDNYLIKNPLQSTTSLSQVILNVVSIVRILLIMMAVLYLLYAGFMFVTARGEPAKISKARNALLWGMVGIALILAAQVIVTTLKNTVSSVLQ